MELSATRNTKEVMSEVAKVIGAVALLAAYAALSHWNHSDRVIASDGFSTHSAVSMHQVEQPGVKS